MLNSILQEIPVLNFVYSSNYCPACKIELKICKTNTRKVYTLTYGTISAKEYIQICPQCKNKYRSPELTEIVKTGRNYGYECLIEAGCLRYIEKKQIEEIKTIFNTTHQITISETQIRRLCYEFLLYLGKYHYLNTKRINERLAKNGGYILHIDSTCEGRKPHLLTCIDSLSNFTLYSQKINSENEKDIKQALEKVKLLFGLPLCIVHDMGLAICKACTMVFYGVLQIICHFHLLRDIGKDFFNNEYRMLQKALSKKEIYAAIRYQTQAIEKAIGSKSKAEQLIFKLEKQRDALSSIDILQGILYGYLLNLKSHENTGDGYGFPFDRPKLAYYSKIVEIYKEMGIIEQEPFSKQDIGISRFYKIKDVLKGIAEDESIREIVLMIEQKISYFDRLREIMKIALPEGKNGLNDNGNITTQEFQEMEVELSAFIQELKNQTHKARVKIDFSPLIKQGDCIIKWT